MQNTAMSSRSRSASIVAPWVDGATGTADFDPLRYVSFDPAQSPRAVELLI